HKYQNAEQNLSRVDASTISPAVLAEAAIKSLLEVNGDLQVKGDIVAETIAAQSFNDLSLKPLDTGFSITNATGSGTLTVSGVVSLDQALAKTSSPTFTALTTGSATVGTLSSTGAIT